MGRLDRRVAVVTGSGRGIGRAVVKLLASEGAAVVVNDIDADVADETVAGLREEGYAAQAYVGDVTAVDFGVGITDVAIDRFGSLDIIVTNAGYTWDATIQKASDEQFQAMLDVHLVAPFRLLRAAQPHIRRLFEEDRVAGRRTVRKVVNVSSLSGTGGNAGQVSYATAKAGVTGLTKSLAKEWGRYAVTVNAVAFGLIGTRLTEAVVDEKATIAVGGRVVPVGVSQELLRTTTALVPLGRPGTVEDAAGAIALFTYPESDYITGEICRCAGGFAN